MPDTSPFRALGYPAHWEALFEPYAAQGLTPARGDRGSLLMATPDSVVHAKLSARFFRSTNGAADLPAVGDWMVVPVSADPNAARFAVESVEVAADVIVMNALAGDGIQPILEFISARSSRR